MSDESTEIWIVEDNDQNFELAEFLLSERGYRVARASDGGELRALMAAAAPPTLLLLDMHLPGTSGEDLLIELRRDPRYREVPVIALTAHALRGDRERFLRLGCDGYLSKPIDIKSFVADLEGHIARHSQAGGAA